MGSSAVQSVAGTYARPGGSQVPGSLRCSYGSTDGAGAHLLAPVADIADKPRRKRRDNIASLGLSYLSATACTGRRELRVNDHNVGCTWIAHSDQRVRADRATVHH